MNCIRSKTLLLAATCVANSVLASHACAQSGAPVSTAAPAAAESTNPQASEQLEDIVVTAQKRSENLQNVPIAVSAITASALQARGISGALDLRTSVPNLNITNSNGEVTTSLRGIGSNAFAPGFENPVAIYFDGVYLASQVASFFNLSNIAQIEVLKGPQGTLFGRNATGGVVQVSTRDPSAEPGVEGSLSYGNYQTVSGTLYATGALTPDLRADLSFYGAHQGRGFGRSLVTGQQEYQTKHDISVRSKWVWTPATGTKVTLIGDYSDSSDTLSPITLLGGTISGYAPARGIAPDLGYDTRTDVRNYKRGWAAGGSVRIDQDVGRLSLVSITAYRQSRYDIAFDYDGSDYQPGANANYSWPDRQFSQELQLQSRTSGPFKWTVGGYYFRARAAYDPIILNFLEQGVTLNIANRQRTESIAGFAQGTYALLPNTNLTLGGRFTREIRTAYDGSIDVHVIPANIDLPSFVAPDLRKAFNKFTFRASLDHRFSNEFLAYASFNRGFKSGGFNTGSPGTQAYNPETIDAYEAGLKTDLLDRRLRVNIAGFYNKYDDVQSQNLINGVISITNAAKATVYGLDLDLQARVAPNFSVNGGLGLVHAEYDSYPAALVSSRLGGMPSTLGSAAGNRLPLSSPITASAGFDYSRSLGSGRISLSPNLYYNGGFYFEADNQIKQKRFVQLNTTLRWTSADDRLSLAAFGKNLTDRRVLGFATTIPNGTHVGQYAAPRTYGLTAGFKF